MATTPELTLLRSRRALHVPQVVLITGATSAIGRSLAHDLFRLDCRLILCARNDHDLEQLKSELISAARKGILWSSRNDPDPQLNFEFYESDFFLNI